MSKAALIIMAALVGVLSVGVCGEVPTEPTYSLAICETALGNYTTKEYEKSLIGVLADLVLEANSSIAFYSTSSGTTPDKVFGQYYCRGDIPSALCGQCVNQAAVAALIKCPNAKAAAVFFQECNLHYKNQPLLGVELESPGVALSTASNVADPESFFIVANNTMSGLVMEAVSAQGKFATGEGAVSATEIVHCLVQCSPDMNATQCASCLDFAANVAVSCCGHWPSALYVLMPSCQMMYNTLAEFYYTPNTMMTPPSSSTPPSSLESVRITSIL